MQCFRCGPNLDNDIKSRQKRRCVFFTFYTSRQTQIYTEKTDQSAVTHRKLLFLDNRAFK